MADPQWKEFEKLVERIHAALDPSAIVKHNEKILGRDSGILRQIDVTIRKKTGPYEILVVIDCKDWMRPVDVQDVGAFSSVKEDVGAHCGAMVSKKGYTQAAITFAKSKQIKLLTFEDTARRNWLNGLKLPVVIDYWILSLTFLRFVQENGEVRNFTSDEEIKPIDQNSKKEASIADLCREGWLSNSAKAEGHFTYFITSLPPGEPGKLEVGFNASRRRFLRIARLDFLGLVNAENSEAISSSIRITASEEAIPFPNGQIFTDTPTDLIKFGLLIDSIAVAANESRKNSMFQILERGEFFIEVTSQNEPLTVNLGLDYNHTLGRNPLISS